MNSQSLSPLILRYEETLLKDPRSKVFAPLAEAYRKVGLYDKAMSILQKGLRYNPDYIAAYITLAYCYNDLEKYENAYSTLRPLAASNRDNIRLQNLFGELAMRLSRKDEALDTYKYLLFLNPKDKIFAKLVAELEDELKEPAVFKESQNIEFNVEEITVNPAESYQDQLENWIQVDLKKEELEEEQDEVDEWEVKNKNISEDTESDHREVQEAAEELVDKTKVKAVEAAPVITHTLVDLYIKQGHIDQAREILEKILELSPDDEKTFSKLENLKKEYAIDDEPELIEEEFEGEGQDRIMSIFDEKFGSGDQQFETKEIEAKLWLFHQKIKEKSDSYKQKS